VSPTGIPTVLAKVRNLAETHEAAVEKLQRGVAPDVLELGRAVFEALPPVVREILLSEATGSTARNIVRFLEAENEATKTDPHVSLCAACRGKLR